MIMHTSMIIMLFTLFGMELISATMPCDGIEFRNPQNTTQQIPAGVCRNYLAGAWSLGGATQLSEKLVCLPGGSDINIVTYDGINCQDGKETKSYYNPQSATDYYDLHKYINYTDISFTCCSGIQCNYGMIRRQEIDSCSDVNTVVSNGFIEDEIYVINSCVYKYSYDLTPTDSFWEIDCENNTIYKSYYGVEDEDCTGTVIYEESLENGEECESESIRYNATYKKYNATHFVLCGVAEAQQCGTTTTLPPFKSSLDCNGVEFEVFGETITLEAGVCNVEFFEMNATFECAYNGNDVYFFGYSNNDCSGTPLGNMSVVKFFSENGINDYAIVCCEDACEGAKPQNVNPSVCDVWSPTLGQAEFRTTTTTDSGLIITILFNTLFVSITYVLFL